MRDFAKEVNDCPLDATVFIELATIANEALSGRRRSIPPDAERCLEDLPPNVLYLTDAPMNQMGLSIVGECNRRFPSSEANRVSQSFMFRWFALHQAFDAGRLAQFVREKDGETEVHGAVMHAAARGRITPDGKFESGFEDLVRDIANSDGAEG